MMHDLKLKPFHHSSPTFKTISNVGSSQLLHVAWLWKAMPILMENHQPLR